MANISRRSKVTFPGWVCYAVVLLTSGLKGNNARGSTMETRYFGPTPAAVAGEHWMQTAARELGRQDVCQLGMPLGMEDGRILDDSITASSYCGGTHHAPRAARLNIAGSTYGWHGVDSNPWIQVEFTTSVYITGVITQGCAEGYGRVTKYQVAYGCDGQAWAHVADANSSAIEFPANIIEGSTVTNTFSTLRTRFLRILPVGWSPNCCMRFEVLGCYPGQ